MNFSGAWQPGPVSFPGLDGSTGPILWLDRWPRGVRQVAQVRRSPAIDGSWTRVASGFWDGLRVWVTTLAVLALLVGGGLATYALRFSQGVVPPPIPASSDDLAAEEDYPDLADQVEDLRKQVDGLDARILAGKTSEDEVARHVAELWDRHPSRKTWLTRADQSRDEAKKLAEAKSFAEAEGLMKEAATDYRKLLKWREHARKALVSIAESRTALREKLRDLPDVSQPLTEWPDLLSKQVEEVLLRNAGEDGPALARRVAGRLPEFDPLLAKRRELVELSREGKGSDTVNDLGPRFKEASLQLLEADRALVKDRLDEVQRLYTSVESSYQAVANGLNSYLQGLLESARGDTAAGNYAEAIRRYRRYLEVRPDEPRVGELLQSAAIAERIARIRGLEREESVTALNNLRREQPNAPEVKAIVEEFTSKIEASGKRNLAGRRYDDARKDFRTLRRLLPDDPKVAGLLESVDRQKKQEDDLAEARRRIAALKEQADLDRALAAQREAQERKKQAAEDAQNAQEAQRRNKSQTFGAVGVPAQGGGIFVIQSNPGTPAASLHGGLEYGDVILTINGQAVNTEAAYWAAVRNSPDYMKLSYRNVRNNVVYDVGVWLNR